MIASLSAFVKRLLLLLGLRVSDMMDYGRTKMRVKKSHVSVPRAK
jgi:hypothetical protein